MIVRIDKTFDKNVEEIRDTKLLRQIEVIIQDAKKATDWRSIKNLKKLSGF